MPLAQASEVRFLGKERSSRVISVEPVKQNVTMVDQLVGPVKRLVRRAITQTQPPIMPRESPYLGHASTLELVIC